MVHIDVTSNIICFVLGYAFTNKIYLLLCNFCDKNCRNCCSNLISLSMKRKEDEINLSEVVSKGEHDKNNKNVQTKTSEK